MKHVNLASTIHSRRFWLAVVTAVFLVLQKGLGLDLPASIQSDVMWIIGILLGGDALVQAVHVHNAKSNPALPTPLAHTTTGSTGNAKG